MRTPKPIKIAGYTIPVVMKKNLKVGGINALGCYQYVNPKITLNNHMTGQEKAHTLLHEAIHAVDRLYGIGLKESQIARLEVGMGDLIVNNPSLVKELAFKK